MDTNLKETILAECDLLLRTAVLPEELLYPEGREYDDVLECGLCLQELWAARFDASFSKFEAIGECLGFLSDDALKASLPLLVKLQVAEVLSELPLTLGLERRESVLRSLDDRRRRLVGLYCEWAMRWGFETTDLQMLQRQLKS
jgi:hypothetical protein